MRDKGWNEIDEDGFVLLLVMLLSLVSHEIGLAKNDRRGWMDGSSVTILLILLLMKKNMTMMIKCNSVLKS